MSGEALQDAPLSEAELYGSADDLMQTQVD